MTGELRELRKGPFFEFLNRRTDPTFVSFMSDAVPDEDFIDWNGAVLPYHYGDAEQEYHAIRQTCALFDVSPMRKIRVSGTDAGEFFDHLLTRPVSHVPPKRGVYVIFCNEDGTLKDDAILYKFSDSEYLLLPSDIDHSPYFRSLSHRLGLEALEITECTSSLAGLAIQGPDSARVMVSIGFTGAENLTPYEFRQMPFEGDSALVARMGFTADLGYEIWLRPDQVKKLEEQLEAARLDLGLELPGYGLDALEACRIEGGFVVAGWDFATEIDRTPGFERNPFEVGLGWAVQLDGPDFVGKEALATLKSTSRYLMRRVSTPVSCELAGREIFTKTEGNDEVKIGAVNCSGWSPGLEKTIGNAAIEKQYAKLDSGFVLLDNEPVSLTFSRGAFVDFERRNQVPAPLNG